MLCVFGTVLHGMFNHTVRRIRCGMGLIRIFGGLREKKH